MNCAEFQKVLPYIIETGGNATEEQHLHDCPVCSDLVQDLKYIAEQAKLLVPMEDPSPRVWAGIKLSLEREGLIKPARVRGRLLGPMPWIVTVGAMILLAFGAFLVEVDRQRQASAIVESVSPPLQIVALNALPTEQDDEQLMRQVAESRPGSASTYQSNLKQVNAAIADARKALEQNPDDEDARQALRRAYQQKAILYEMAMRTVQ